MSTSNNKIRGESSHVSTSSISMKIPFRSYDLSKDDQSEHLKRLEHLALILNLNLIKYFDLCFFTLLGDN